MLPSVSHIVSLDITLIHMYIHHTIWRMSPVLFNVVAIVFQTNTCSQEHACQGYSTELQCLQMFFNKDFRCNSLLSQTLQRQPMYVFLSISSTWALIGEWNQTTERESPNSPPWFTIHMHKCKYTLNSNVNLSAQDSNKIFLIIPARIFLNNAIHFTMMLCNKSTLHY